MMLIGFIILLSGVVVIENAQLVKERSHPSADFDNICELRGGTCIPNEACPRQMIRFDFCDNEALTCCIERKQPRNIPKDDFICGQRSFLFMDDYRVVGGKIAMKGAWPWQVSIVEKSDERHICGGVIISKHWILTAAHCIVGKSVSNLQVIVGEHERYKNEYTEVVHAILKIIKHEYHNPATKVNDIALLKLRRAITYTEWVQSICLPESDIPSGSLVTVTGWGHIFEGGPTSIFLMQVTLYLFSNILCKSSYGVDKIGIGMICAGLAEGGKDSCKGDSGGPLVYFNNSKKKWELVGIVSWGTSCAQPETPGVYVDVYFYLSWIKSKLML